MHRNPHTHTPVAPSARIYRRQFGCTLLGARRARLAGSRWLADSGWPADGDINRTAALLIGELAANAALHGRPPGDTSDPGFGLTLALLPGLSRAVTLRIELTDHHGGRHPHTSPLHAPAVDFATSFDTDAERGRGLVLVDAFADRWGVIDRMPPTKSVWAELTLDSP